MIGKSAIYAIALAVMVAVSLTISPEEPFQSPLVAKTKAVEYIGGDGKTTLRGHWYYSNKSSKSSQSSSSPIIIMAHGFGLTQDQGLQSYVQAFQQAGMNAFTFDYATFGQSDGLPRHQISPFDHVADLRATIDMITTKNENKSSTDVDVDVDVDATRIGLWGTSLAGGHVLQYSSDQTHINSAVRAVVSQVPHLASGMESVVIPSLTSGNPLDAIKGLGYFALGLIKWSLYTLFLNKPAYYPMVGLPGSAAMMQNPGDYSGYLKLAQQTEMPKSTAASTAASTGTNADGWVNAAIVVGGLKVVLQYRPLSHVESIVTPTLLIAAQDDTLCPAKYVKKAHALIAGSEYYEVGSSNNHAHGGHFDIYGGKELQDSLEREVAFFQKHLL
uniref:Serine aminopeptidase S33 domain-containing protein n=1 Tax=Chaetoceros debilis TaxID=122233 RepID=A0A7S3VE21_9STRA|mmetsp:Transcript_8798/g.13204  ORF Transcript_8798/g.13204 Transcript_8798/m.13204 type:complete len:387 (+) Transcript_8798:158-1318(+)|eukprot:CAMPEP_0194118988 /NCGR_PEP_ID=MMETSP0150-20130528/37596_1 /TAXON_ID=122233 /ORGANISM="Chaetoceros debilis, Strain MM31A-1" /LENGTH=386 /DNA_ID=CAMNT_0038810537 /DNA_START=80 /DNA_END=1240 /DNA_ORIENTATION=-